MQALSQVSYTPISCQNQFLTTFAIIANENRNVNNFFCFSVNYGEGQFIGFRHRMAGTVAKGGAEAMRRTLPKEKRRFTFRLRLGLWGIALMVAALLFNAYVNSEIRPTLMELAEYEARAITLQAIHEAVSQTLEDTGAKSTRFYTKTEAGVQIDTAEVNRFRSRLVQAVQERMQELPEQEYRIPFGSLTGNSLLSGHGPAWKVSLRPEGYMEAEWQEKTESLSINTTRYTAEILLQVTVNMILDGRTETLTVTDSVPMVSMLLQGGTPSVYAQALD